MPNEALTKEQRARIGLMAAGDPTWDLSPKDCAAIKSLLSDVERLEREREALLKEREDARIYILEAGPDTDREWSKKDSLATWIHNFGKDMQAESAESALRAQQWRKPTHETNNRLLEFATRFTLDGDWMKCRGCRRAVVASGIDEPLSHKSGCPVAEHEYPWREFMAMFLPAAPAETREEK